MQTCYPGTIVARTDQNSADFLNGIFTATKGLMLAQVKEITGLDTSTIQNWIARGWVANPIDKRYNIEHLARIILINMLRDVMKLEHIALLMTYINGDVEDATDNIVPESRLYAYVCIILDKAQYEDVLNEPRLVELIKLTIADYHEPFDGAYERLVGALEVILVYYASAIVKYRADDIFSKLILNTSNDNNIDERNGDKYD